MFLVSRDDALHQRMPHHVTLAELDDRDAFRVFQRAMRLRQAGMLVRRQIDFRTRDVQKAQRIAGGKRLRLFGVDDVVRNGGDGGS